MQIDKFDQQTGTHQALSLNSRISKKRLLQPSKKGTACDYELMTQGMKRPCDTCQPFVYNDNKQCNVDAKRNVRVGYVNSMEPTWMGSTSYDGTDTWNSFRWSMAIV